MAVPSLSLKFDPVGPNFAISEDCRMPTITATAVLKDAPDAGAASVFDWEVKLNFLGGTGGARSCPHCHNRSTEHSPIRVATREPKLQIPFTQVRGGDLTVKVSTSIGLIKLSAVSEGLQVVGTNPLLASLVLRAPSIVAFRKLLRLESQLRQFRSPSCPLWSADNLGGVGLCQLTPAPNADAVWNWQVNLSLGVELYRSKERIARAYPRQVRSGHAAANLATGDTFPDLVRAYNEARRAAGQPPLQITLPDFTDDQLQRDTLRGFNGYAGGLHEYRVKLDDDGQLDLVVAGAAATAQWELVTPDMRTRFYDSIGLSANHRGDPNYVEDVLAQQGF